MARRTRRVPFLFAALVCATAAFAGCGGGDSTTATGTVTVEESDRPLTRAEMIERADAVCSADRVQQDGKKREAETLGDAVEQGSEVAYRELADLFDEVGETAQVEADDLRGIEPPAADEEVIGTMLDDFEEQIQLIHQAAEALREEDLAKFAELGREAEKVGERAKGIAEGYGFKVCGNDDELD